MFDELCGNVEMQEDYERSDCLVVDKLKDYDKYAEEPDEDAFPSDMLANAAVFRQPPRTVCARTARCPALTRKTRYQRRGRCGDIHHQGIASPRSFFLFALRCRMLMARAVSLPGFLPRPDPRGNQLVASLTS